MQCRSRPFGVWQRQQRRRPRAGACSASRCIAVHKPRLGARLAGAGHVADGALPGRAGGQELQALRLACGPGQHTERERAEVRRGCVVGRAARRRQGQGQVAPSSAARLRPGPARCQRSPSAAGLAAPSAAKPAAAYPPGLVAPSAYFSCSVTHCVWPCNRSGLAWLGVNQCFGGSQRMLSVLSHALGVALQQCGAMAVGWAGHQHCSKAHSCSATPALASCPCTPAQSSSGGSGGCNPLATCAPHLHAAPVKGGGAVDAGEARGGALAAVLRHLGLLDRVAAVVAVEPGLSAGGREQDGPKERKGLGRRLALGWLQGAGCKRRHAGLGDSTTGFAPPRAACLFSRFGCRRGRGGGRRPQAAHGDAWAAAAVATCGAAALAACSLERSHHVAGAEACAGVRTGRSASGGESRRAAWALAGLRCNCRE